jgi:hypothetical protein
MGGTWPAIERTKCLENAPLLSEQRHDVKEYFPRAAAEASARVDQAGVPQGLMAQYAKRLAPTLS